MPVKKPKRTQSKAVSLYSNLAARRKSKVDAKARRKAEYLATLPKQPLKRLLHRLHPKQVVKFWFSKQGAITFLKLAGVALVILAIFIAALFAYYRRELDAIRPEELAKRVQTTVTNYWDRNGVLLWQDKGEDAYKQVVESDEIAEVMKQATIAIEDRDFYKHAGISLTGITRAAIANATGGDVQGASTLTQQLIKQVFFAQDVEQNRIDISRKIKEMILSIEVERMYNKDQILTLYLNESPYGGRRNGVESASLSYFGKGASELNLPEAALLAAIPQNPSYYNPQRLTPDSSKALIERQQKVINDMVEVGYISQEEAEKAKAYPILDTVQPEISATENIKAPHFVLEVRDQLEREFGTKLVRDGGLNIKTTLDYRIQQKAEESITNNFQHAQAIGGNNMAMSAIDVATGQIMAMVGSYDYRNKEYGEVNAATALLNPGSSIKPFVYAELFKPKEGLNYGAGTILSDENIDAQYQGELRNFDNRFMGAITIRQALGMSRNPPAVKAAIASGIDNVVANTQRVGNKSYCEGIDYGLSAAIGSCAVRLVEHVNSYATLARQGTYQPETYILEVKNAQGQVIKQWEDQTENVLDSQITYMLSDILSDSTARARVFGWNPPGMFIPGVKTATKTGTTDDGHGSPKDSWMMSYSPRLSVGVWTGRNDPKPLHSLSSTGNAGVIADVQSFAHQEIFQKDGSWKPEDWFTRPAGIQTLTVGGRADIFPSWYVKPKVSEEKIHFDQVSKKRATDCTPGRARIELGVQNFKDPVTNVTTRIAPSGYDPNANDDVHKCGDAKPTVSISASSVGDPDDMKYKITAAVTQGTFPLSSVEIRAEGKTISNQSISSAGNYSVMYTFSKPGSKSISATVLDQGFYDGSDTTTETVAAQNQNVQQQFVAGRRGGGWRW